MKAELMLLQVQESVIGDVVTLAEYEGVKVSITVLITD